MSSSPANAALWRGRTRTFRRVSLVGLAAASVLLAISGCTASLEASDSASEGLAAEQSFLPAMPVSDILPSAEEFRAFNAGKYSDVELLDYGVADIAPLVNDPETLQQLSTSYGSTCAVALLERPSLVSSMDAAALIVARDDAGATVVGYRLDSVDAAEAQIQWAKESSAICAEDFDENGFTSVDTADENSVAWTLAENGEPASYVAIARRGDVLVNVTFSVRTDDETREDIGDGAAMLDFIMGYIDIEAAL